MSQATLQLNGAVTTVQLNPKTFKTGSTGFHGHGKINASDGKYQVNVMAIKVGSKVKA